MHKTRFSIHNTLVYLTILLLPTYIIRFRFGWVSLNLLEILILVLFLFWLFQKSGIGLNYGADYFVPTLLVFLGLFASLFANIQSYYTSLGIIKGWFVFPVLFAIVLLDSLEKEKVRAKNIIAALFFSGIFISLAGIYYWQAGDLTYDGRLRILFDSPNQLAMFLAPTFLIGALFTQHIAQNTQYKRTFKYLFAVLGVVIIWFNLYLTKSFGAWLAIGLAFSVVFWLKYKEIVSKKYLVTAGIIFIIFMSAVGYSKFENLKNLGERSSLASRAMIWKSAGMMVKNNPFFGIGPGNFQETYLEYQRFFPPYLEWAVPQPHNLFLAFWLESGMIGLTGFIWLLVLFFRDNRKVYPLAKIGGIGCALNRAEKKQAHESLLKKTVFGDGTRENNSYAGYICLAVILYFLLHGFIDTTYWRNDMAVIFWVVIALNFHLSRQENDSKDSTKKISNI